MAEFSKHVHSVINNYSCKDLIHPWNENCVNAQLEMVLSTIKRITVFFSIMHLAQNLSKLKKNKNIRLKQLLTNLLRSIILGVLYATSFISLNCLFSLRTGRISINALKYFAPFLSSCAIFVETAERKDLIVTTFIYMAMEGFYKSLIDQYFVRSKKLETVLFMIVNASLMYALRRRQQLNGKNENLWFITPTQLEKVEDTLSSVTSKKKICSHENSCKEHIFKDTLKYGSVGFLVTVVRFFVSKMKSSSKNDESFFHLKILKLPIFLILYVFILRVVSCSLCNNQGKDDLKYTILSGFLAGTSYWFSPNSTTLFTAVTVLLKIGGKHIKENYKVPNLPYTEISFALTNTYLLNLILFNTENTPRFFLYMISYCSSGKFNQVHQAIKKALHF